MALAAASLTLPLTIAGPAHAAQLRSVASTETDDDSTAPPYSGDATTPPPTASPTIELDVPEVLGKSGLIEGTVTDAPDATSVRVKVGSAGWSTVDLVDGHFSTTINTIDESQGQEVSQGQKTITAEIVGVPSQPATVTVNVLFAPTISKPPGPIGKNGQITGSDAFGGAQVTVQAGGATFTGKANPDGSWSIPVDQEVSHASATARQTVNWGGGPYTSAASASVPITVDLTAPRAPTITSPKAGSTVPASGAVVRGVGEPGSTVKVFAGPQTLCTVDVSATGTWSCTATEIANGGAQAIVAKADDAAGNSSGDGTPVSVTVGSTSSPSDPPENSPSDEPSRDTNTPDDENSSPTEKEPEPSESDDEHTSEAAPPAAPPNRPGPWNHATPFTESLPPAIGVDALAGWFRALLLAALTIALILIPARMLAGTLARRRAAGSAVVFAGRNRSPHEFDKAPLLAAPGRVAMIVIGIVAAGAITIFANPVDGRPAYLRLLIAAVTAAAIINAAAAWLPRILSHAWQCGFTEVRMNPRWLLVVVAAVLASRILDLNPALLFALVTTVRVPTVLSRPVLARLALSRIGAVFLVGVFAWLLASLVPQGGSFFTQLLIETANITALVGIGSAAIMMVPLGRLSGRAIFAWSRPLWLGSVLAILTALFVMLGPSIENWRATGNILAALALVFAFAALGISVWLWKRYVQPMLAGSSS
ncbi:Ig-like domain-containing protein [Paramicrobacterium agarici]|uniref:Ig-like domain-containing protein n=1 Tax=Paramicrobacterium agarici TaxID=630514 RepID=UPI00117328EF|nr:Ig-like domain-containing protein [Microbacterium agarici]TQO21669.1 hypothetical protein FB385_0478 [Microbacterium agarici]